MGKTRVNAFSISADGYGSGPKQGLTYPLGQGGEDLHNWYVPTRSFQSQYGRQGGTGGVDEKFAARSTANVGAWIIGRNMFGPVRGPWSDDSWRGWWGSNPPYHCPVFVLTHHPRASVEMEGGTVFHFVSGGIHEARDRANDAAGEKDIRIGGGAATIRQYLQSGLIDEMHVAITPVLLGSGESLFANMNLLELGYAVSEHAASDLAMHVVVTKKSVESP